MKDSTQKSTGAMGAQTDAELVIAARGGRREAFDQLTERYFGMVYAIAYARLTNRDSAEDLAQEVFLRAYLLLDRLENPQTFCAWIGRIARNLATDWERHKTRVARILSPEPIDTSTLEVPDMKSIPPSQQIEAGENEAILRRALDRLPIERRELVLLHYMEDLSHHEIARRLGMTQSTVSRQLQQTLGTLKEAMTEMMRDGATAMRARPQARARTLALVLGASAAASTTRAALVSAAETATAQALSAPVAAAGASGLGGQLFGSAAVAGKTMTVLKAVAAGTAAVALVMGGNHYFRHPAHTQEAATTAGTAVVIPSDDDTRPVDQLLREAAGYATVYNIERVEQICDHVNARTTETATRARAHWIKAYAYGRYNLEYRTQQFALQFAAERDLVRQLQPEMAADALPRLEAGNAVYVRGNSDMARILADAEAKYAASSQRDHVSANALAQYYLAVSDVATTVPYLEKALALFERAVRLRPESYEYVSHYITVLAKAGRLDKAEEVASDMLKRFPVQPPYSLDQDPSCLYVAVVQMKNMRDNPQIADTSERIVRERARSAEADPTVHLQVAQLDVAKASDPPGKLSVWEKLVDRLEADPSCVSGMYLRTLVSAYYKYAHALNQVRRSADALAVYQKIQAFSPNYAEVHYNKGILLSSLAQAETDLAKKTQLQEEARHELQLQSQYNWHGTAADTANKVLARMGNR